MKFGSHDGSYSRPWDCCAAHRPLGQFHQPGGLRRRDNPLPSADASGPSATQYIEVHPTFFLREPLNLTGLLLVLSVVFSAVALMRIILLYFLVQLAWDAPGEGPRTELAGTSLTGPFSWDSPSGLQAPGAFCWRWRAAAPLQHQIKSMM